MSHKDGDQRRQMEIWQPTNQSLGGGPQPTMVRPMEEGAAHRNKKCIEVATEEI